jgi:hypothetical protein
MNGQLKQFKLKLQKKTEGVTVFLNVGNGSGSGPSVVEFNLLLTFYTCVRNTFIIMIGYTEISTPSFSRRKQHINDLLPELYSDVVCGIVCFLCFVRPCFSCIVIHAFV